MKLLVGLGNPGKEYEKTRHNIGFMILDLVAEKFNSSQWKSEKSCKATEYINKGEKIVLIKPQKFINLSGEVLKEYMDYYKITSDDILVIHDDLDLKLGRIKLVKSGSSAGHNGLKNIEKELKTQEYKRIKIGIGKNKLQNVINHVLGKVSKDEEKVLKNTIDVASQIVIEYLEKDFSFLMNKYNRKEKNDE